MIFGIRIENPIIVESMKNDVVIIRIIGLTIINPIIIVDSEIASNFTGFLNVLLFCLISLSVKVNGETYIVPISMDAINPVEIAPNSELSVML